MMGRWPAALAAAALLLLPPAPTGAAEALRCSAPEELTGFRVPLPNTARAIRHGKALVIVAIGSSSTEGFGASDQAHTYPARLAEELRRRWPRLAVTVINKGVGGEMTAQTMARFERDVVAYRPQLVIWQTGSNQVLRGEDVESYARAIRDGIGRLKAARMDVVLMDPQFAPRMVARPMHRAVVDSIEQAANDMKVAVFRRFAVMRHWVSSGQYRVEDVISRDGLHMNDASYGCIARLLADSLATAAHATPLPDEEAAAPGAGSAGPARR
ncbi:MAG TPA: SGNH/GDSL hydrolase family protein [Candidatus Sulfotelmatobacter sp.]|nr:SGNH/GDSL hydrolase family protein [Candidatus Sulfotelmatobacter sp.]